MIHLLIKYRRTRESNAELFVRSNAWQKLLEDRGIDEQDPESLTNKVTNTTTISKSRLEMSFFFS